MESPWASLVLQSIAQLLTLLLGGVLFTMFWGMVVWRRDSIMRQFERQASWMDEVVTTTKEALEGKERLIELLERVERRHLKLDDGKKEALALRQDEKGTRAANAIGKASNLILAESLIQNPDLKRLHKTFHERLIEYQKLMVSANAFANVKDAAKKVERARERLLEAINLGMEALAIVQSETDVIRCIRCWRMRFNNYVGRKPKGGP